MRSRSTAIKKVPDGVERDESIRQRRVHLLARPRPRVRARESDTPRPRIRRNRDDDDDDDDAPVHRARIAVAPVVAVVIAPACGGGRPRSGRQTSARDDAARASETRPRGKTRFASSFPPLRVTRLPAPRARDRAVKMTVDFLTAKAKQARGEKSPRAVEKRRGR